MSEPAVAVVESSEPVSIADAVNAAALDAELGQTPAEGDASGAPDTADVAKPGEKATDAATVDSVALKALLEAGDIDGLAKALGVKPAKVVNGDWARLRQRERAARDAHAKQVQTLSAREAAIKAEEAKVGHLLEARKAHEEGDVQRALELLIGDGDIDSVLAQAIKQKHGSDPRVAKMERELKAMQAEKQRVEAERQAQAQQAQQAAEAERIQGAIARELQNSDDELQQAAGGDPKLIRMVHNCMLHHYHNGNPNMTIPEALDEVIGVLRRDYETLSQAKWLAAQPGSKAANTDQPGKVAPKVTRTVSHVRASQAAPTLDVPKDDAAFGAFLREQVNRAQRQG